MVRGKIELLVHGKREYRASGGEMMAVEITIPKPTSEAAEHLAHKMNISLSELYTAALAAYVAAHQKDEVTGLLDRIYSTEPSTLENELVRLQLASIGQEVW
jgi:hypothetical protein